MPPPGLRVSGGSDPGSAIPRAERLWALWEALRAGFKPDDLAAAIRRIRQARRRTSGRHRLMLAAAGPPILAAAIGLAVGLFAGLSGLAGGVVLTTVTDVVGYMAFLGLGATLLL